MTRRVAPSPIMLELPLAHFLEEAFVLLTLLERFGVAWKIRQILVVPLSEPLPGGRLRGFGGILSRQRRDLFIVHGSPAIGGKRTLKYVTLRRSPLQRSWPGV